MIKRTLYFGNPAYLSLRKEQLLIQFPEVVKNETLPETFKDDAVKIIPMFQFSIYLRHCASRENADVHVQRVKNNLPPNGHVGILCITDKQFGNMELFIGKKEKEVTTPYQQLELF